MLVQLLNMRRLEEEGGSRLGKVKEEQSTATFLLFITPFEHINLQLNYIVCINMSSV